MANSIEDIGSNFFLKLIQWQISFVIKTGIFMWSLPFKLVKSLMCQSKDDDQKPKNDQRRTESRASVE